MRKYKSWGVNLFPQEWTALEKTLYLLNFGGKGGRVDFVRCLIGLCRTTAFAELMREYRKKQAGIEIESEEDVKWKTRR